MKKRCPWKKLMARVKQSARSSSRTKGRHYHTVILTPEQIRAQWNKQNGRCYWLGIKLSTEEVGRGKNCITEPSIDRLDNSQGYFPANIVIVSRFANLGRVELSKEAFTPEIKRLRKLIYNDLNPKYLFE